MAVGEVVAEVGEMVAAVVFFIDHVGMGDNCQEREGVVSDIEPVGVFENRLFSFKDEGLGVKMGNAIWNRDGEERSVKFLKV